MDTYDCKYLLGLGDLFNVKSQRSDALQMMKYLTDQVRARDGHFLYVQGQHELSDPPLVSTICGTESHYINDVTMQLGDIRIHGLDYRNPLQVEEALRGLPEADILCTHQVWKDFMGDDRGHAKVEWVPECYKWILTGDYHETKVLEYGPNRHVVSPGSLNIQKVNETPDKFVYVWTPSGGLTKVPLKSRGVFKLLLQSEDDLDAFIAGCDNYAALIPQSDVPPEIAMNILRISYNTAIPNVVPTIERAIGGRVHLFWDPLVMETGDVTLDQQQRQNAVMGGGLPACLREFYAEDGESKLADRLVLWESEDPKADLDTILQRVISETQQNEDQPTG